MTRHDLPDDCINLMYVLYVCIKIESCFQQVQFQDASVDYDSLISLLFFQWPVKFGRGSNFFMVEVLLFLSLFYDALEKRAEYQLRELM